MKRSIFNDVLAYTPEAKRRFIVGRGRAGVVGTRIPHCVNALSAIATLLLAVLLAACGPNQSPASSGGAPASDASPTSSAEQGESTRVRFALDWTPNTNHTGIYVAQAKGWYEEQGIDLEILPYAEGTTTDQLVTGGQADLGVSFEESVVMARAAGLPVKSVAAVIQHNTSALVALEESDIESPKDLQGKRYAGFGAPFEEPVISAMIECDGGEGEFESVTANLYGYEAVKAGQADFVWIFMGWDGVQAEREGVDLKPFYIREHCVPDYYTPVIITSDSKIEQDPETVRRFMAATARGYEWAIEHPEEAADLLVQEAPEGTFSDPGLVTASQRWLSPKYKEGQDRWGVQELEVWTEYPRFMYRTGKVTDESGKPIREEPNYEQYFTNEFLP